MTGDGQMLAIEEIFQQGLDLYNLPKNWTVG
jgi:hypothetical protein